jgi:hypothetical protein
MPVTRVQAEEYIERSGLSAVMKDAVLLLLENRSRARGVSVPCLRMT